MEKLFREWDRWGWHRVTFYGDLKEPSSRSPTLSSGKSSKKQHRLPACTHSTP
jgi:hypothetical protein